MGVEPAASASPRLDRRKFCFLLTAWLAGTLLSLPLMVTRTPAIEPPPGSRSRKRRLGELCTVWLSRRPEVTHHCPSIGPSEYHGGTIRAPAENKTTSLDQMAGLRVHSQGAGRG